MKKLCGIIGILQLVGVFIICFTPSSHAQRAVALLKLPAAPVELQQVELSAEEAELIPEGLRATPLFAPESLPFGGTFFSLQLNPYPPLPGNMLGLPCWSLGDGMFLMNDILVDYEALRKEGEVEAKLAEAANPKTAARTSMMALNLASGWAYGNPVYLTNLTVTAGGYQPLTVSFGITGGTNFVPYDILMSTNVAAPMTDWNWLGIGYTANSYTFNSQPTNVAFYRLAKPSKTMTVPWGDNYYGQCDIWAGITNAVAVSGGYSHSLALLSDGKVKGWGYYGASSDDLVPTNLASVAMIACGWNHNVALLTNGTVTVWGDNTFGALNVPTNLANITVVSAQALHSLVLRSNGTVVAWGDNAFGQTNVPTSLTNVTAIAAGGQHSLVVSNGIVIAWGGNGNGQCTVPTGLSNVWDVAAGWAHSVALKTDGTVSCWGDNSDGACTVPANLTNVVAIAAGGDLYAGSYTLALKKDGAVVVWGDGEVLNPLIGMSNVIAIAGGESHGLAIRSGPPTPVIVLSPTDKHQVAGGSVTFTAQGVGLYGVSYQWQTNAMNLAGATNATLTLTNVQTNHVGSYRAVVSGAAGSLATAAATFNLVTAPVLVSQDPPTNPPAVYQKDQTLSVTVTSVGQTNGFPVSYQWKYNGTNVGGNSASYSFIINSNTLGDYSVTISNVAGVITSAVWQITGLTYTGSYIDVGTLAYHLSTNAVGRASGYSGSFADQICLGNWTNPYPAAYTSTNIYVLNNATWSTNFWLHGVQGLSATCIGISNGVQGQYLVTMISPRHYLKAHHTSIPGGAMAFLDTNNVVHWRTFIQQVQVGDETNDTDVGILSADLPTSVGYLQVLPTNYFHYLPTNGSYVQGIGMNQEMRIFGQPTKVANPAYVSWSSTATAPFGLSTNWNLRIVPGDSSNPERLLIGNQLVLASENYVAGGGPNYVFTFDAINEKMHYLSTNNAVGTDYQLTQFLLTNWPAFQ